MRGKGLGADIKEKALARLMSGDSVTKVSEALSIPYSTVYTWFKASDKNAEIKEAREDKKKDFIDRAWRCVEKSQRVIERRIERVIAHEAEIDGLIEAVEADPDMSFAEKRSLLVKLSSIRVDDIGKLAALMGTMYDKHALAVGDPTVNHGGSVRFEDL